MDEDIKEIWTGRLRSGAYYQIQKQLRDSKNGRCCLGVLCDIFIENHDNAEWEDQQIVIYEDDEYDGEGTVEYKEAEVLPTPVIKWAKLDDMPQSNTGGRVPVPEYGRTSLASLNDGGLKVDSIEQRSFEEIADLIEEQL